jgi:hypothetical protein
MWEQTEVSPALAAPGSNNYGNDGRSTGPVSGRVADKVQGLDTNDLCKRYLPLAYKLATQYTGRGVDLEDL